MITEIKEVKYKRLVVELDERETAILEALLGRALPSDLSGQISVSYEELSNLFESFRANLKAMKES